MPYIGRAPTSTATKLEDADQDTKIQLEESSDEDTIRFDIAGAEDFTMTANTFTASSGSTITTPTLGVITAHDLGAGVHVRTSDTGGSVSANSDELVLEGAGNAGLTILSQNDSVGQISFGDGDATQPGIIQYAHGTDRLEFYTNSTKHMQIDSTGAITKPLQPCVIARHNANVTNVTGDGTYYTTLYATEIIDRNSDFVGGTGIFTAPVTGVYSISGYVYAFGVVAATNNFQIDVVTSNRTHSGIVYFATMDVSPTEIASSYAMLVDMDASDTAYVNLRVNNGSKVVDYASNSAISFALIA